MYTLPQFIDLTRSVNKLLSLIYVDKWKKNLITELPSKSKDPTIYSWDMIYFWRMNPSISLGPEK